MPDEANILVREQRALITRRLPPFAIGWLGAMGVWLVVFAIEGRLTMPGVLLGGLQAGIVAAALRLCRTAPDAPRVLPVVLGACMGLGIASTALAAAIHADVEILAFMLLTLYLTTALVFGWGWRAELALIAATLVPWALVLPRFQVLVRPLEMAAAVTIGALLALAIAEGTARSFRYLSLRRRAQARVTHELQVSRDAYRDLAEHARDMIWSSDLAGRLTYVNEATVRFYHRAPAEFVGRSIAEFFAANPRNPDFAALMARAVAGEVLPPQLIETSTPAGPRWLEVVSSAVRGEGGHLTGFRGISRDVSERVAAEDAVRESEERFRSAFDHAAIGMVVVGMDGKPVQINRAFCEMLGYDSAELATRTMDTLAHPDDVSRATTETGRLLMGEVRAFHMEKRYLHKDGHIVWCLLSCSLTRDALGEPLHLIAQVQDISERKATEDALRASEGRYRGLVESQHELIVRLDARGRFTFVNDAYAAKFGRSQPELLGQPFLELVHPDDHAVIAATMAAMAHPPHRALVEIRNLTAGGPRWVAWEGGIVLDEVGRIVEAQAVGRDVTERRAGEDALRESEERFRSAFDDAAIGMGVTTIEGRALRVNPALCAMFGYTEHEFLGRSLHDIVHPDDRAALRDDVTALVRGSARTYRAERRYLRANGQILWAVATASVVRDVHGAPLYLIGQLQDVTERRLAEEALRGSLAELRLSEEKLRLLAQRQVAIREEERKRLGFDLHDDVCQELVGVGILVESLRRKLAPMPAEHAAEFDRVVGYLGEVIEHLRLLARELRPLLLRDLGLDGSLRSLADGMSSATVRVVTEFRGTIPRFDEEAEVTVYRIAQEALANTARHAAASCVVVALDVHLNTLRLEIRDDGRGFDPAVRPAAALGLASMEERALALGGRLQISSAPGAGTTVALTCPVAVRPADRLTAPGAPSPTRSSSPPSKATRPRSAARD